MRGTVGRTRASGTLRATAIVTDGAAPRSTAATPARSGGPPWSDAGLPEDRAKDEHEDHQQYEQDQQFRDSNTEWHLVLPS